MIRLYDSPQVNKISTLPLTKQESHYRETIVKGLLIVACKKNILLVEALFHVLLVSSKMSLRGRTELVFTVQRTAPELYKNLSLIHI